MTSESDIQPEVRKDLMKATFRALCKHGYADITMKKIADESDKCKSTLHYHYGTKQNLMVDFIKYLLEGFEEKIVPDSDDPLEKLNGLIDRMLFGLQEGDTHERFHTALLELRSQAPYNEKYREQITKNDEYIQNILKDIIKEGVQKGRFKDIDPEITSTIILSSIDGARARQISTNREAAENVREALKRIIQNDIIKDQSSE